MQYLGSLVSTFVHIPSPPPRHYARCPFVCGPKIEKVQRVPPVEAKNLHVNPHKKIAIFNFEKISPGFSGVTREYAHEV